MKEDGEYCFSYLNQLLTKKYIQEELEMIFITFSHRELKSTCINRRLIQ